ncbi:MAG: carboxypeptidase regulatory-like domain-containing protein, partial [Saprospiraceae bacterium]|nr:carboxypeptidase regulatory-like domain-containing protein [Saprospiraceae bacterium]
MQNLKWFFPLILLLGVFFTACEDNDPLVSSAAVEVTFAGRILDENDEPVSGALIKAGDETSITDANGVFRLAATRLPQDHAVLSVEKAGYFAFSRAYQVQDKSIQSLSIRLLSQKEVGFIANGSGGTVQVPGGATLVFPASAVALSNGNPYNGTVRVFARFLDPTDQSALALSMPGNLSAINAAGELRQLSTFGMIGVELYSDNGQKLNVAAGQQVEVRIPIDPAIASSAPAEMPLWHYNVADGYWFEEGLAKKEGNEYVGSVSHFSWWNYDAPYPSVNV